MRDVSFHEYVKEILKRAKYTHDPEWDVVVAVASDLPGCMTQAQSFEETREELIDVIELWISIGLRKGEDMPVINNGRLAPSLERPEGSHDVKDSAYI